MKGSVFNRFYFINNILLNKLKRTIGIPSLPAGINFVITNKCNSKCLTCNIWKTYLSNPKLAKQELELEEIRNIFKKNNRWFKKVRGMQITGGEPTLKDNLSEIVYEIHKILPKCSYWIASNGLLPNKIKSITEDILNSCNCELGIGISLEGSEKIHDNMRGIKGSYKKAIYSIENLIELKKNYPKLNIAISYTLTQYNFREVDHVLSIAKKYNIGFTFRPINISPIYYKNIDKEQIFKRISPNKLNQTFDKINNYLVKGNLLEKFINLYYIKGAKEFIIRPSSRKLPCYAGYTSFFLDQFGNVFPCLYYNCKLGNLREQSFKDIWLSNKAKLCRKNIKKLNCPKCWVECETFRDISMNLFSLDSLVKSRWWLISKND